MSHHLVVTVRLHDARYHGADEWPPAPARLFQALIAGVAQGASIPASYHPAFEWLERSPAPMIAAPQAPLGQAFDSFVPNNDADALGGELTRLPEIRTKKRIRPRLLPRDSTLLYVWPVNAGDSAPLALVEICHSLYQFGRGVDMAWADAELLAVEDVDRLLAAHPGHLHRPAPGSGHPSLACAMPGSFQSLLERHALARKRLRDVGSGRDATVLFLQPPKPRFAQVAYDVGPARLLYELRYPGDDAFQPWPLWKATSLVERLRDAAAERLKAALPLRAEDIERTLVGKKGSDRTPCDVERRVRIIPLPSVGHSHADQAIRRFVVEVPRASSLRSEDVNWAFSSVETCDPSTGIVDALVVTPGSDRRMLDHYSASSNEWRTVTPAVLPESARRRRIEPRRRREEQKGAAERSREEAYARSAVLAALRHAGVRFAPLRVEVQREPFDGKGVRAERFATGTRFPKERLWHVRLELSERVDGPLLIGDGRFLGLGLLAPRRASGVSYSLSVDEGLEDRAEPVELARSLRRAVMSRVQALIGRDELPSFFSGHAPDGAAVRSEDQSHVAFQAELPGRLLVFPPEVFGEGVRTPHFFAELLERALSGMTELRAGKSGLLAIRCAPIDAESDPLFDHGKQWCSVTPYAVNRHRKLGSPAEALQADVLDECARRGFPRPSVSVESVRGVRRIGLEGILRLAFPVAMRGPLLMGRTRHLGGGLFAPVTDVGRLRSSKATHGKSPGK